MDAQTLEFVNLVANALNYAKQGNAGLALALLPQVEQWIKTNAPEVNLL